MNCAGGIPGMHAAARDAISEVVNAPNWVVSVYLPRAVFR